jgi:hypothetical protein
MARPRSVPSYRRHRQSGQAVVTLTDGLGSRKDVLLGKHGTAESRAEYARVISENWRRIEFKDHRPHIHLLFITSMPLAAFEAWLRAAWQAACGGRRTATRSAPWSGLPNMSAK